MVLKEFIVFEYLQEIKYSTLNAPIATKVFCFSRLLKCRQKVWTQIRSWFTLFASILKFVSNARQLFAADDFRETFSVAFFSWRFKG